MKNGYSKSFCSRAGDNSRKSRTQISTPLTPISSYKTVIRCIQWIIINILVGWCFSDFKYWIYFASNMISQRFKSVKCAVSISIKPYTKKNYTVKKIQKWTTIEYSIKTELQTEFHSFLTFCKNVTIYCLNIFNPVCMGFHFYCFKVRFSLIRIFQSFGKILLSYYE